MIHISQSFSTNHWSTEAKKHNIMEITVIYARLLACGKKRPILVGISIKSVQLNIYDEEEMDIWPPKKEKKCSWKWIFVLLQINKIECVCFRFNNGYLYRFFKGTILAANDLKNDDIMK